MRDKNHYPHAALESSNSLTDPSLDHGLRVKPRVVFCCLWATGMEPGHDQLTRVLAIRRHGNKWVSLDRAVNPSDSPEGNTGAAALEELGEFIGDAMVVTPEGSTLERWLAWGCEATQVRATSVAELAALLTPGRQAAGNNDLIRNLMPEGCGDGAGELTPADLIYACGGLMTKFQRSSLHALQVAAKGYSIALDRLRATDPGGAQRLQLALSMAEHPSTWNATPPGRREPVPDLQEHILSKSAAISVGMAVLTPGALPRWHAEACQLEESDPLPPRPPEERPLDESELKLVDDLFLEHLPRGFAEEHGLDMVLCQRPAQHEVARAVAEMFGTGKLLLIHAPTGTGKTLAYLLPAMIWARANGARIGLATYTRALQEQAMEQDVPRALAALERAGQEGPFSVSLLKGRSNYVCWRALEQLEPQPSDDPEHWLAWTALVLFALTDPSGDLDRFPKRSPVRLESAREYRRSLGRMLSNARAQTGCCLGKQAARTCAAHVARRRAERSNVVLMNHALVLSTQEFVRTVVFDECEHLHDSAASAWEHRIDFPTAHTHLNRLHGGRRGGILDRLHGLSINSTVLGGDLEVALVAASEAGDCLTWLEEEATLYTKWRRRELADRGMQEAHSLLGEYLSGQESKMVQARKKLMQALMNLDSSCAGLADRLAEAEAPGTARVRRQLEVSRGDLNTLRSSLGSWLPVKDDTIELDNRWWYEVETNPAGDAVLVATPLLPHELLGSQYYPDLQSAAFMSATTKQRGSFDGAMHYLGLHFVAQPQDDEGWTPRTVKTVDAPEVFDYSRVFVGIMRDAPDVQEKQQFLDYTTKLIEDLTNRTRGRTLVLFTSLADCRHVGERLRASFEERHLPLWYQGMPGLDKEELATLFRDRTNSVLLGVDTFWYGADFPGETLEYLIIARLPYGVPGAFHHAQCALMGVGVQREAIYMPRALAKFRQGFGRLMRRTTDRGCVLILDKRIARQGHRAFLADLPLAGFRKDDGARILQGESSRVLNAALEHMGLGADEEASPPEKPSPKRPKEPEQDAPKPFKEDPGPLAVDPGDIPW